MDTGKLHGPLDQVTAMAYGGFVTLEDERAYLAYCEERDREHEAYEAAGGRSICPECGVRAYLDRAVRTRQYGGGWDTYYYCEACGHTDVAT